MTASTLGEIIARAEAENITGSLRPGVYQHLSIHANKPPDPATHRMFYATREGRRRLFREADEVHPKRKGKGKMTPEAEAIPEKYRPLLDWYRSDFAPSGDPWLRGIFEMIEAEKSLWEGIDADEYVRQVREGWD